MIRQRLLPIFAALLLAACTGLGTQMSAESWRDDAATPEFEAYGRMGVKENERCARQPFSCLK